MRNGGRDCMVRKGIGSDSRTGKRFLFPGVGYGGSCFPKDVQALAKTAQEHNYEFRILQSVMDVNEDQKSILSKRIIKYFGESVANKTIGIWGLSFKPNTDDIREAPALTIINELLEAGAKIKAFDPEAMDNVKEIIGDKITFCDNQYDAIEDADALAVITEWNAFRTPDYNKILSSLKEPIVFDGRNVFDPEDMKERGFVYSSIGRP